MTLNYENIKQKLKENTKLSCEKNTHTEQNSCEKQLQKEWQ